MTVQDLSLLTKKIAVGVVITAVPTFILIGGLWLTQHTLAKHKTAQPANHPQGSK